MSCMTILFSLLANHKGRHQATSNKGCQTGDRRWTLNLPQGFVIVNMYWSTYPLNRPQGFSIAMDLGGNINEWCLV